MLKKLVLILEIQSKNQVNTTMLFGIMSIMCGGVAIAGWPLGAIFTGIFCNYAMTQFGWKYAFFIAGCISWALPSE